MTREQVASELLDHIRAISGWVPSMRLPMEQWLLENADIIHHALVGTEVSA